MRAHVIEVGPTMIRRLCCGTARVADAEAERTAFESIDDPVALVDLRPVSVDSLWHEVLASVDCGTGDRVTVVHPSWWSSTRVDVVRAAAQGLTGDTEMRSRSWLLARAAPSESAPLAVEITADFVVVTGASRTVEAWRSSVEAVAEAVGTSILTMAAGSRETVVIDAPATVPGGRALAEAITRRLSGADGLTAVVVDDIRLRKLAGQPQPSDDEPRELTCADRPRTGLRALTLVVLVAALLVGVEAWHRHTAPRASVGFPTQLVVEGHVALEVPAQWSTRRLVAGPGSPRLQIASPDDPEVAVLVTQSRVALTALDATAGFLRSAIDAAPAGVFVDFNPAGRSAGHPVVNYREVRAGHDIRWSVWIDRAVRISIGCQSRSGRDDAVSRECELAVRSARAWN